MALRATPARAAVNVSGPSLRPALRGGGSAVVPAVSRTAMSAAPSTAEATSPATTKRLTPDNAMEMIDSVDVFIFDCDGVIWKGDTLIEGVSAILDKLRSLGKKVFFVTNNSTKSRKGYKAKFDSLGLDVRRLVLLSCPNWLPARSPAPAAKPSYLSKRVLCGLLAESPQVTSRAGPGEP